MSVALPSPRRGSGQPKLSHGARLSLTAPADRGKPLGQREAAGRPGKKRDATRSRAEQRWRWKARGGPSKTIFFTKANS